MSFFTKIDNLIPIETNIKPLAERVLMHGWKKLSQRQVNLLFIGMSKTGKKSTVNILFNSEKRKKTTNGIFDCYKYENLTCWVTQFPNNPNNKQFKQELSAVLNERNFYAQPFIDLVVVIDDANKESFEPLYQNISDHLEKSLNNYHNKRLIVALNKADETAKNIFEIKPKSAMPLDTEVWLDFITSKICHDIIHLTGLQPKTLFYSAKSHSLPIKSNFNLVKLIYKIVSYLPIEKRFALIKHLNQDPETWLSHDKHAHYDNQLVDLCSISLFEHTRNNNLSEQDYIKFYKQIESYIYLKLGYKILI